MDHSGGEVHTGAAVAAKSGDQVHEKAIIHASEPQMRRSLTEDREALPNGAMTTVDAGCMAGNRPVRLREIKMRGKTETTRRQRRFGEKQSDTCFADKGANDPDLEANDLPFKPNEDEVMAKLLAFRSCLPRGRTSLQGSRQLQGPDRSTVQGALISYKGCVPYACVETKLVCRDIFRRAVQSLGTRLVVSYDLYGVHIATELERRAKAANEVNEEALAVIRQAPRREKGTTGGPEDRQW